MKEKTEGYLYLGLCILFWASIPIASKKILVELNNLEMLFYSTIFSFLILGLLMIIQKKHNEMKKISLKEYLNMAFLGFLGTYLYYVLLYGAFALTTAQEGFILAYTWPILVLLLAFVILKEKITLKKILAILISFVGIIVIVTQGDPFSHLGSTNLLGDFLALLGALVFAFFSILGKKYNFDKTISAFIYFLSALVFITITVFIFSPPKIPSLSIWFWLLYNGILVNGVTYIWYFHALEKVETHIVSTYLYLTPFISLLYIWLFLDEKIMLSSIFGLIIIIFGITLQSSKKNSS